MLSIMARVLLLALATLAAQPAAAALLDAKFVNPTILGTREGFVVNDLLIDFEGQLFGQQMIVQLDSGLIHQGIGRGETAPDGRLFIVFPTLASDTFVTMGGAEIATSEDTLVVGSSTVFSQSDGTKEFNASGIDITWAPATGVVIEDRTDFMVARLTFSDDAHGRIFFYSNSGGVGVTFDRCINGGRINPCPEPTSALLLVLASAACLTRRPTARR
ncbi:hypothetical protein MalM25_02250 [Planctomycetes bacterium MalM25]|nr:hypothetical protein MalM25_02250 [Planctomycetes bacterium MalM25]